MVYFYQCLWPLLLPVITYINFLFKAWIGNNINIELYDVITYLYPNHIDD